MHVYKIVDLFYETLPMEHQQAVSKPKLLDAALLHDVGKLGIDDEILNKKGALTEGEWDLIRQHPRNGKAALSGTCYDDVADWICYHHERVDGRGYYGLSKDEIPLASKIIAIADVYSALRADRVYRPKFTHEESCQIMRNASGTQFDQTLLRCFLKIDRQALDEITMKTYSRRETAGALIASSEG